MTGILVRAALACAVLVAAAQELPFARYPARDGFRGRPAAVNLASDRGARRYRTVLREGAARGPNFAGAYTVVTWGCGTNCRQLAVVSARDGRVFMAPFALEGAVHYRRDSQLFVADPYSCGYMDEESPERPWRQLYRWNGTRLVRLDSMIVPLGQTCDAGGEYQ